MKINYLFLVLLLFASGDALCQIEGDVRDKMNNRIPEAVIIVMDTTNKAIDSVISKENGFYSFQNLRPGKYNILARARGFENRLYKNVIANENLINPDEGKDLSNATRLQIILSPRKNPKQ